LAKENDMRIGLAAAALLAALLPAAAQDEAAKRPRVDVVFALDTTGSMAHLIEGAKKKIWSIAGEIVRAKPAPHVRIGLVAYRDKGDAYVTRVTPLSDDLDKVYTELMTFQADGGGDGPENVRQALHDAVKVVEWTKERGALRIIFLVGDAPPHEDYTDVPTVEELCRTAVEAGLIINTVRCGPDPTTGEVWKRIADLSEGQFVTIEQGGGVVAVATPFDKELSDLSDRLGGTLVAYGTAERRERALASEEKAKEYDKDAKADRAAAKAAAPPAPGDGADLVDAVREGRADLEKLSEPELPEELRKLTPEGRKAYVEAKAKERDEVRARILEISKQRESYISEELKKRGVRDSFDEVVLRALRKQAAEKGITIEEK
jgi:Mg-chelatase subunit ChlD